MDKKKLLKSSPEEDLKGFEEFIDHHSSDPNFLPRGNAPKKEVGFEHFTFITNDSTRLMKLKDLLMDNLPFASQHEQGENLIKVQQEEIALLKKNIFEICNKPESPYRTSMQEIFDSFFGPTQN